MKSVSKNSLEDRFGNVFLIQDSFCERVLVVLGGAREVNFFKTGLELNKNFNFEIKAINGFNFFMMKSLVVLVDNENTLLALYQWSCEFLQKFSLQITLDIISRLKVNSKSSFPDQVKDTIKTNVSNPIGKYSKVGEILEEVKENLVLCQNDKHANKNACDTSLESNIEIDKEKISRQAFMRNVSLPPCFRTKGLSFYCENLSNQDLEKKNIKQEKKASVQINENLGRKLKLSFSKNNKYDAYTNIFDKLLFSNNSNYSKHNTLFENENKKQFTKKYSYKDMFEIYSKMEFNTKDKEQKLNDYKNVNLEKNYNIKPSLQLENPYIHRQRINFSTNTNDIEDSSYADENSNLSKIINEQEYYSINQNLNCNPLNKIEKAHKNTFFEIFIDEIMIESNEPNKPKLFLVNWPRKMTVSGCKISCKPSCDCFKHNSNITVKDEESKLKSTNSTIFSNIKVSEMENKVRKNLTSYFDNTTTSNYNNNNSIFNQNNKHSSESIIVESVESNENLNILNTKSSSDDTEVIKYYPYSRSRAFTYNKQDHKTSKKQYVDYDYEKRRKSYITPNETIFYSSYKGVGYSSYNYGSYYPYNSSKFKRGLW